MGERVLLYWMVREAWGFGDERAPLNVMRAYAGRSTSRGGRRIRPRDDRYGRTEAFAEALSNDARSRRWTANLRAADSSALEASIAPISTHQTTTIGAQPVHRRPPAHSRAHLYPGARARPDHNGRVPAIQTPSGDDSSRPPRPRAVQLRGRRFRCQSPPAIRDTVQDVHDDRRVKRRRPLRGLSGDTVRFLQIRTKRRGDQPPEVALDGTAGLLLLRTPTQLLELKTELETALARVMTRTERLAATEDRSGMLVERESGVTASDVHRSASTVHSSAWRTWWGTPAPWNTGRPGALPLELHDGLQVQGGTQTRSQARRRMSSILRANDQATPPAQRIAGHAPWIPRTRESVGCSRTPSSAACGICGCRRRCPTMNWEPFAAARRDVTKDYLLGLEGGAPSHGGDPELRGRATHAGRSRTPPAVPRPDPPDRCRAARFTRSGGRLTGMPVLGLLYPSFTLASLADPLDPYFGRRMDDCRRNPPRWCAAPVGGSTGTLRRRLTPAPPVPPTRVGTGRLRYCWTCGRPRTAPSGSPRGRLRDGSAAGPLKTKKTPVYGTSPFA